MLKNVGTIISVRLDKLSKQQSVIMLIITCGITIHNEANLDELILQPTFSKICVEYDNQSQSSICTNVKMKQPSRRGLKKDPLLKRRQIDSNKVIFLARNGSLRNS
jgi:hypothetical protein